MKIPGPREIAEVLAGVASEPPSSARTQALNILNEALTQRDVHVASGRTCENCGIRMSPRWPRTRLNDGRMVCPMCAQNQPRTAAQAESHPHELWQKRAFGCYHTSNGRRLPVHEAGLLSPADQDARMRDYDRWDVHRAFEPNQNMVAGAQSYNRLMHLPDPHDQPYQHIATNKNNIVQVGRTYDALPEFDRAAIPSFEAMRHEVSSQYHHLTNTMGVHVQPVAYDPYKNVHEMHNDLLNNKRLKVLNTETTGGHPFFTNEENDKFRAVHDAFGHAATGRSFDANGEEAAWMAHSKMFSRHALPALTSETRGQNASLHLNGNFGPQRIALLPRHLWLPGGDEQQPRTAAQEDQGELLEQFPQWKTQGNGLGWEPGREKPKEDRRPFPPKPGGRFGPIPGRWPYRENDPSEIVAFNPYDYERWGQQHVPFHTTSSVVAVRSDGYLRVLAHDSGSVEVIYHCPFCGSGQVIARSDGTIFCEFCNSAFTVQVQPEFSAFPQTIDGQPVDIPGLPADANQDAVPDQESAPGDITAEDNVPNDSLENGPPEDADNTEDEPIDSGGNPLFNKHSYRTATGHVLSEIDYIRHLALTITPDRQRVLARIRMERLARR